MGGKWKKTKKSDFFLAYCFVLFGRFSTVWCEEISMLTLEVSSAKSAWQCFIVLTGSFTRNRWKEGSFSERYNVNLIPSGVVSDLLTFFTPKIWLFFFCHIGKLHNCERRLFQNHTIIISSFLGISNLILFELYILSRSKRFIKFSLFIALDFT